MNGVNYPMRGTQYTSLMPLSTLKCNGISHACNVPRGKYSAPNMERRESLSELVRRVRQDKGYSLNEVSRRSGLEIANSHISRIENGESTNVSVEKLQALAKGLGISEVEVFAAARGGLTETEMVKEEHARLIEMYSDIPAQCQKDVMDLLAVLQNNHSISRRRERLIEHRETATRRREAALSPHPPGEELLPGEIVVHDADSLAEMFGVDDSDEDNNTERERKSA
jgi:transcriptional regulator with XRE-family HTH domain